LTSALRRWRQKARESEGSLSHKTSAIPLNHGETLGVLGPLSFLLDLLGKKLAPTSLPSQWASEATSAPIRVSLDLALTGSVLWGYCVGGAATLCAATLRGGITERWWLGRQEESL
ncbi:mCG141885, partial [Mus musculus]